MSSLLEDTQPERPLPQGPVTSGPNTVLHAGLVGGVHTDLVVTRYTDKLFVAITQVGKLGTICEARRERVEEGGGVGGGAGGGRVVYSVNILLGQDTEEVHLLGRILAEKLSLSQPLVLCVGVKGLTLEGARELADFILPLVK